MRGKHAMTEVPVFMKDDLPAGEFRLFRKRLSVRAVRIEGPFRVWTTESENEPHYCDDGWLAIDARGYPYPIAADEFDLIYEPVEEGEDA